MNGILWLASYPKSGNTWLRVFIENLFRNTQEPAPINAMEVVKYGDMMVSVYERFSGKKLADLDDAEIHAMRRPLQHWLANQKETALVKTHNALWVHDGVPLICLDYTAGAVYLLRNAFDVTVSVAHHYGLSMDEAVEAMCSSSMSIGTSKASVFQVLGSWSDHYRSWFGVENFDPLLLRYEDMVRDPLKTFGKFMKFLGVPKNPERLKRAIRNSAFAEVSKQEKSTGFKERVRADQTFFRAGKIGDYRNHLTEDQIKKLVDVHYDLLLEQKYIDKDGRPRV